MRVREVVAIALMGIAVSCTPRRAPMSEDEVIAERLQVTPDVVQQMRAQRSLPSAAFAEMTPAEAQQIIRTLRPDLPQRRASFRNIQLRGSDGVIPALALPNAIRAWVSLRMGRSSFAGPPTDPNRRVWQALGPSNRGGRTRSIVIDPADPQHIFAGSVGGGLWESRDGGAHFEPVPDFMPSLAICCMVMDPKDSRVLYVGTGEGFYSADAIRGAGIFRRGPDTKGRFELMTGTDKAEMEFMTRLAISADGTVLLAASRNAKSFNNGLVAGVYRFEKAAPAAGQWRRVKDALVMDVQAHPTDPALAVAGGYGAAYYSSDAGKTWHDASPPGVWGGRVELRYVGDRPEIVYALAEVNGGEVWRSTDGGQTYVKRATTISEPYATILGDQGLYDNVLWVDPKNENLVVAGGIELWRSTDGGDTFSRISDSSQDWSPHADQHAIIAHPAYDGSSNRTVYVGNDGGIYRTRDISTAGSPATANHGWESLNATYATTQFYGGAVSHGAVLAGSQDLGNLALGKGGQPTDWRTASEGDGAWVTAHPQDKESFIGEYIHLALMRFVPGQAPEELTGVIRWRVGGADWKPGKYTIPDAQTEINGSDPPQRTANFLAPFALDPRNPKILYAGGASLWRTLDADAKVTSSTGPSWEPIKDPEAPKGHERLISAISILPANSDVVWVAQNDGRVFRTRNATAADPDWEEIDKGPSRRLPRGRMATRIVLHPTDPNVAYLTFGGFEKGNIWRSTDDGSSWTSLQANLKEVPFFTVAIHPSDSRVLYLGSELGLFSSIDGGASWTPDRHGLVNCSVQDLFWSGQTLFVATHGRGMFKVDLSQAR